MTGSLHKTLASYPGDRYQTADEAITQLQAFLSENERHVVSLYGMGGIGKSTLVVADNLPPRVSTNCGTSLHWE